MIILSTIARNSLGITFKRLERGVHVSVGNPIATPNTIHDRAAEMRGRVIFLVSLLYSLLRHHHQSAQKVTSPRLATHRCGSRRKSFHTETREGNAINWAPISSSSRARTSGQRSDARLANEPKLGQNKDSPVGWLGRLAGDFLCFDRIMVALKISDSFGSYHKCNSCRLRSG